MSKRAGAFHSEEYLNGSSKKPKLNEGANLIINPEFDLGDNWNVHRACLEDYFNSKCIDDDLRKISILITTLGQDAYKMLLHSCKPELPYYKAFEQLCEIMERHYLETLVLKKRREFNSLHQFRSETVIEWFTRIKEVAAQCDYGEQLDNRIKDQFVNGMEEGKILDWVLKASYKISLQNFIEIALKREEELCPIKKLPEEILIKIFSYLPIVDRVRVERVNRLLQEMAKKSWNNQKQLKMDLLISELKAIPYELDIHVLEAIVIRCGIYLKKIDLTSCYFLDYFSRCVLPLIAKYCPNIQSIISYKVSVDGLKKLSEKCMKIVELRIEEFEIADNLDQVLGELFAKNQKLQSLDMMGYQGNSDCLSKLLFEEISTIKIPSLQQWESSEQK